MKKIVSLIIVVIMFMSAFSLTAGAYRIGDVVGYALTTDIAATINGYDIPSYNVSGHTYIVVEDLRYYGFSVYYDNASRSLSVSRDYSQEYVSKVYEKPYVSPNKIGAREHKLLYTDIVTYLDGSYVPSSNINGQTIIRFDALSAYGGVSYDNNKREISLDLAGLNYNPFPVDRESERTGDFSGGTTSGKTELEKFIDENGYLIKASFEEGFSSGGMTCTCKVYAVKNTLYLSCNIDGLNNIPKEFKNQLSTVLEAQKGVLAAQFSSLKDELFMDKVVLIICEEDGDVIVTLDINLR